MLEQRWHFRWQKRWQRPSASVSVVQRASPSALLSAIFSASAFNRCAHGEPLARCGVTLIAHWVRPCISMDRRSIVSKSHNITSLIRHRSSMFVKEDSPCLHRIYPAFERNPWMQNSSCCLMIACLYLWDDVCGPVFCHLSGICLDYFVRVFRLIFIYFVIVWYTM